MAGILSGQAAVDELERQLGRKPTAIEKQIAMEEGYSKSVYTDSKGVKTSGWGQTGENMGVPLNEVAAKYENRTQKLIPAYNTLPDFVKNRAFDATYRGTLGQSPMTVDLMNMGQYGDAADEFLNNQEYRDAVISGSGVAKRMEKTADAFRVYGNQKPKQVVPKMNRQQMLEEEYRKQGQYGQYPTNRQVRKQVRADNTAASGNAISSLFSNLFNTNTAVPPAAMPSVIDMNGGQVDPRVPTAAMPVTNSIPSLSQFTDPDAVSPTQYNTPAKNKTSIFDSYKDLNVPQSIGRGVGQTFDAAKDTVLGANRQAVKLLQLPQDMGDALDSDIQFGKDVVSGFTGSNTPVPQLPIPKGRVPGNKKQPVFPSAFSEDPDNMGVVPLPPKSMPSSPAFMEDPDNMGGVPRLSTVLPDAPKSDKIVPALVETPAQITARVKEEFKQSKIDSTDTGTDDLSSVDTKTFKATDGEGKEIDVPPEQVKGIFDKASEQFGDMFSASDLKRMTLYTLGGLISGGSFAGSFQWAGMKVMQEQEVSKANQEAKDAKTLDYERLVARELTALEGQQLKDLTRAEFDTLAAKALSDTSIAESEKLAIANLQWRNLQLKISQENSIRQEQSRLTAAKIEAGGNNTITKTGDRYRYVVTGGELNGRTIPIVEYKTPTGNEWYAEAPGGLMPLSEFEADIANKKSPNYGSVHEFGKNDTVQGKAKALNTYINGDIKNNIQDTWERYGFDPKESVNLHASIIPYMKLKGYNVYDPNVQEDLLYAISLAAGEAARDKKYNNADVDNLGPYVNKMLISTAIGAPNKGVWSINNTDKSVDSNIIEKFTDQMMKDSGNNYMQVKESFKGYYADFKAARKAGTLKDEVLIDGSGENQFSVYLRKKLAEEV